MQTEHQMAKSSSLGC